MRRCLSILALGVFVFAGCGGPTDFRVFGDVTWNGKPIPEGTINFIAEDMAVAPDSAKIVNGKYDTRVKAGRKKIEVYAHRAKPGDPVMNQMGRENYIPTKYNALSTLVREVKPDGENHFDFALTEKD